MTWKSCIERYCTPLIVPVQGKPLEDHYLHVYPNNIFVIGLAPSHAVFQDGHKPVSINFDIGGKNRSEVQVCGKRSGGLKLQPDTKICEVTRSDGQKYLVYACLYGSLLQVNEKLHESIQLLSDDLIEDGWIAIAQVPKRQAEQVIRTYLSDEQAAEALARHGLESDS